MVGTSMIDEIRNKKPSGKDLSPRLEGLLKSSLMGTVTYFGLASIPILFPDFLGLGEYYGTADISYYLGRVAFGMPIWLSLSSLVGFFQPEVDSLFGLRRDASDYSINETSESQP